MDFSLAILNSYYDSSDNESCVAELAFSVVQFRFEHGLILVEPCVPMVGILYSSKLLFSLNVVEIQNLMILPVVYDVVMWHVAVRTGERDTKFVIGSDGNPWKSFDVGVIVFQNLCNQTGKPKFIYFTLYNNICPL